MGDADWEVVVDIFVETELRFEEVCMSYVCGRDIGGFRDVSANYLVLDVDVDQDKKTKWGIGEVKFVGEKQNWRLELIRG